MKLVIGLGNPGKAYEVNRHNVGHLFVDFLKEKLALDPKDVKVFKTERFMNDSGVYVSEKVNFYKLMPKDLVIVHDDLDLGFGQFKVQLGIGPKIHYGVNSIEESLGDKNFWRVRIGVDARDSQSRTPGEKYVLENFSKEELSILATVFEGCYQELGKLLE